MRLLGNPTNWSDIAMWLAAMDGESYCPPYTFLVVGSTGPICNMALPL